MLKRLWHFFVGHVWREQWGWCPPYEGHYVPGLYSQSDYHEMFGLTTWFRSCECGAMKTRKITGKLSQITDDNELAVLRKIAGIK